MVADLAEVELAGAEAVDSVVHETCGDIAEITKTVFPRFVPVLEFMTHRALLPRTRRRPAAGTEELLLVLERTAQAHRPAELGRPANRTILFALGPEFTIQNLQGLFGQEGQQVPFAASVVCFIVDVFSVFFGDVGTEEIVGVEILFCVDGEDAFLGFEGAPERERGCFDFEGGRASMGTSIAGAFGLGCALEAEEFAAGSFAFDWFGAPDEANRALIFNALFRVVFVLHLISLSNLNGCISRWEIRLMRSQAPQTRVATGLYFLR